MLVDHYVQLIHIFISSPGGERCLHRHKSTVLRFFGISILDKRHFFFDSAGVTDMCRFLLPAMYRPTNALKFLRLKSKSIAYFVFLRIHCLFLKSAFIYSFSQNTIVVMIFNCEELYRNHE